MEDLISTIIYLAITVALVVGGALSRKKKKASASGQASSPASESTPDLAPETSKDPVPAIERLFSSFLDETSDNDPYQQDEEAETFFDEEIEKLDVIPEEEGVSVFNKDDPATEEIETGLYDSLESPKIENEIGQDMNEIYGFHEDEDEDLEFDLRQAIIYSEILNPKY